MIDPNVEERLYNKLAELIGFLARRYSIRDHWMMSEDDVTGECYLALARVVQVYPDKQLPELVTISKTACRNAIKSMQAKVYGTRASELSAASLDEPVGEDGEAMEATISGNGSDPAAWADSVEWMAELWVRLTPLERQVVDALLGGNERVRMYLKLTADRRAWLYDDPAIVITPHVVARAICEPVGDVEQSYVSIKDKIAEVL